MSAWYLLRFDDLCPTMDRAAWERFLPMIRRYGIEPILAVVPENRDPELIRGQEDRGFWEEMRGLAATGATVGLHGYRHLCAAERSGLIPLHRRTEFAGVEEATQREWIRAGLGILQEHGLRPRIFVAPRHGLDRTTLRALRDEGIEAVSDGFAERPYRFGGLIWIPQQVWSPVEKDSGLWTICLHANSATDELVRELEAFLGRFSARFTSVERVLSEWPIAERSLGERLFHWRMALRIEFSRWKRRLTGR